jgi:hypothetical protein
LPLGLVGTGGRRQIGAQPVGAAGARRALSQPPRPRAGISARPLISTRLLADPQLTPLQIWERLLDEHGAGISYATVCHYRRTMTSRARSNDNAERTTP